jgi:hypothetical protein
MLLALDGTGRGSASNVLSYFDSNTVVTEIQNKVRSFALGNDWSPKFSKRQEMV